MLSSFGNRCPAKVLDVPRQADRQTDTQMEICAVQPWNMTDWNGIYSSHHGNSSFGYYRQLAALIRSFCTTLVQPGPAVVTIIERWMP